MFTCSDLCLSVSSAQVSTYHECLIRLVNAQKFHSLLIVFLYCSQGDHDLLSRFDTTLGLLFSSLVPHHSPSTMLAIILSLSLAAFAHAASVTFPNYIYPLQGQWQPLYDALEAAPDVTFRVSASFLLFPLSPSLMLCSRQPEQRSWSIS